MSKAVKDLQTKLNDAGYPAGTVDGIPGPKTASAFQSWLKGAGYDFSVSVEPGELVLRGPNSARAESDHPLPWMAEAYGAMGLHETRDNRDLRAFLRSDGGTLGDPSQFPWCGDFVHTCLRLGLPAEKFQGRVGENPYLARNWLDFGIECGPSVGAIGVVHRGDPNSIYGHVFFYVGEDDDFIYALGGNQSNAVTITRIKKSRLLGYRWPRTSRFKPTGVRLIRDGNVPVSHNEA